MSIKLNVEYKDKDKAKQKGAFWDIDLKTWYIPDNKKISDFEEWLIKDSSIIIKTPLLIAKSSRLCWKCNNETSLIAISSKKFIEKDYLHEESEEMEWSIVNSLTLFFDVTSIPNNIIEMIQKKFPFFKLTFSKTVGGKYWANTCNHCNALQGDFFNHCEPDGAFFPTSEDEACVIELTEMDVKHDFSIIGNYSYGDSAYLIEKYAKRT